MYASTTAHISSTVIKIYVLFVLPGPVLDDARTPQQPLVSADILYGGASCRFLKETLTSQHTRTCSPLNSYGVRGVRICTCAYTRATMRQTR